MVHVKLDGKTMRAAFEGLDRAIPALAHLVVGGGAAMVLAYQHRLATEDVDAFTAKGGVRVADLDAAAKRVAKALDIAPDWLNAHFETYTAVLPSDYASRLRRVFAGARLVVDALGPEDLLVMKCFAGRDKDLPHARVLLKKAKDLGIVDRQLQHLVEKRYPKAERAADWFDDLRDEEGA